MRSDPLYLVLEGRNRVLRPGPFIVAVRGFVKLLREIDASVSNNPNGSVTWEIVSISKGSPVTIGFQAAPKRRRAPVDYSADIMRTCVSGLRDLTVAADRPKVYSDKVLDRAAYLAKMRASDKFEEIRVMLNGDEAHFNVATLHNIETIQGPTFESLGSVTGTLEAISVHKGHEFRVWSEMTGKPVTCRFQRAIIESVKESLESKVVVTGMVKSNALGHPVSVSVNEMEKIGDAPDMPLEEISGAIEDFTGGMTLGEYLDDLRNE